MEEIKRAAEALAEQDIAVEEQVPMALHTSFAIGGPAALMCAPQGPEQLTTVLAMARIYDIPYYILGNGTNVLFCDDGYKGLVIRIGEAFGQVDVKGSLIQAGAGAPLCDVCEAARDAGLAGLEFAYGIPGSVGGAVYMDAGAYGGDMAQVLKTVTYLNKKLETVTQPAHKLELSYRDSIFQRKPWCVLSAEFALQPGDKEEIAKRIETNIAHRKEKQPLDLPNAGSAFKRPEGAFAGALIDKCGLRGYRVGDAAISEKHCGFIVNLGKATCADVIALANHVVAVVKEQTGYTLEKEIRVVENKAP